MTRRKKTSPRSRSRPRDEGEAIELRGVRQNNLKGLDLDLPPGRLTVVTGPSGSGKSSLAFQTLYAEGQRRYVETFSPYTRQFFDRMDKPQVDSIKGIPPAIALEQQNAVRTTRSTVGTITEINDYLKLLFPRICRGHDPVDGTVIEPDTPESILRKTRERFGKDTPLLVLFSVAAPADTPPADFFAFLQEQGYLRVRIYGETYRVDAPGDYDRGSLPAQVEVIQDRVAPSRRSRFLEALERALDLGKGTVALGDPKSGERAAFSRGWVSPETGTELRPPTPGLFSFNHPLGACPECRGFGRVIGIDYDKALPDKSLSIAEGLVKAFQGDTYRECEEDLERCARARGLSLVTPFDEMDEADRAWIVEGEGMDPDEAYEQGIWYGVRGFFDWLESRAYRMHVRVFLSRYRSYTTCKKCRGTRLRKEALAFRVKGRTLPELWRMPIDDLAEFFSGVKAPKADRTGELLLGEIRSRLGYLREVGLGYLDLDRPTRTLSGGEVERVNLTTCLGASLTNTLFVLDEPTVGLHPRDVGQLVSVMERLRDLGNTLVVVEHEEAVIRAADHLVDIGPGRGESGGELIYEGPGLPDPATAAKALRKHRESLTLSYLSGKKRIPLPEKRREPREWIEIERASQHNLAKIDVKVPLGVFCCVTGVSGSGKSTLVHSVLYENLRDIRGLAPADAEIGACRGLRGHESIGEVVLVDQSPLARTPRSTPAVYTGAFELIRKLFAESPEGKTREIKPGYFSFNSGAGRCERCLGNGFEKVEMQFLSDLYVTCPECEGSRYTPEALEIELEERNIDQVLRMTVDRAIEFFSGMEGRKPAKVVENLALVAEVGLGYLRLGQPLNTLSGGESQRLKLVGHLLGKSAGSTLGAPASPPASRKSSRSTGSKSKKSAASAKPALLIFDEPSTGLHFDDVAQLLKVFDRLVEAGHSLLVVEHNLEMIKCADHLVDLGPEAGASGGRIVAEGTPETVAACEESRTGAYLRPLLEGGDASAKTIPFPKSEPLSAARTGALRVAEECAPYAAARMTGKATKFAKSNHAIQVHGARENNLKNIDLAIPRDQFVAITGLSGSGKSTLAFDILFAEGQRRFLDSMSTYARQFVEQMERPDVDLVAGLPPTVAIEQRISRGGGKSTVATVTEVWHFLRLLFAKVGKQHSPDSGKPVEKQSVTAIVTRVLREANAQRKPVRILAPLIKARKGFHTDIVEWAGKRGYETLLVDGEFRAIEGFQRLARFKEHSIDLVVGAVGKKTPPEDARALVEEALRLGKRSLRFFDKAGNLVVMNTEMVDPETGRSFDELDPRLFSYNSPHGWCPRCRGYGTIEKRAPSSDERQAESQLDAELREEYRRSRSRNKVATEPCPECDGARLNEVARFVRIGKLAIHEIAAASVHEARALVEGFGFTGDDATIARDILPEIVQRLRFLEEVGLGYLRLDRSATTLSGGESQRIRLAAQLGSNLRGVLYVLDEPTIGLHPRDNGDLLDTLAALREKGNSLVVVEHDEDTLRRADHLIDLGPGAGQFGGEVVWEGKIPGSAKPQLGCSRPEPPGNAKPQLGHSRPESRNKSQGKSAEKDKDNDKEKESLSPTLQAFSTRRVHPIRGSRRKLPALNRREGWLRLKGASANNLRKVDLRIPVGRLTVITGISGSGKSSLMRGALKPAVEFALEAQKKAGKGQKTGKKPAKNAKAATKKPPRPKPLVPDDPDACWKNLSGAEQIGAVYEVDQSPIGKTSRSTPATYVKVFDEIRRLFAQLPEARARGYSASRFSFNTEGGRCENCKGNGRIKLEMNFLPTSHVLCEECGGRRFNGATLEIEYRGKSIAEVMDLTISEAAEFFAGVPKIARTLGLMVDTGLGYLHLGQASPTLSGGEAQRIKLVTELTRGIGRAQHARLRQNRVPKSHLYLIEEPSIGLHTADVERLLEVLHRLVDEGHTVVVIEHNLEIMAEADHLVDIGPEAGAEGGRIVAAGTPEEVTEVEESRTAPFLVGMLGKG